MSEQLTFESVHGLLRASGYVDANQAAALTYQILALSTHHAAPGEPKQEASGDGSFPFYELRFIMRVLSHKGDAPKEDWDTAHGMARKVFQAWHESSHAAATAPADATQLPDPLGCRACKHPDCGRFDGPRQVECRAMASNACARKDATAPAGGVTPGAHLRKKAEDYAMEYGSDDMGGLSFGSGAHAEVKMDHYNNLLELADELDALTTAARAAEPTDAELEEAADIMMNTHGYTGDVREMLWDAWGALVDARANIAASPTPPTGTSQGEGTP